MRDGRIGVLRPVGLGTAAAVVSPVWGSTAMWFFADECGLGAARRKKGPRLKGGLDLDGATVTGSVFADDLVATGLVSANGASIGGRLFLNRAQLRNPDADSLSLDLAMSGWEP